MMQIAEIIHSLAALTGEIGYETFAINAPLQHGARADPNADMPFALLNVVEIDRLTNSSRTALVTYEVTLQVFTRELVGGSGGAATIMGIFHEYWDKLLVLPSLKPRDKLKGVLSGTSEVGEADTEEFGKDVIMGITSWTMRISEHQPEIGE